MEYQKLARIDPVALIFVDLKTSTIFYRRSIMPLIPHVITYNIPFGDSNYFLPLIPGFLYSVSIDGPSQVQLYYNGEPLTNMFESTIILPGTAILSPPDGPLTLSDSIPEFLDMMGIWPGASMLRRANGLRSRPT